MILPPNVRKQQAKHPLCRNVHPTHIGVTRYSSNHCNRPEGFDTHILILCVGGCGFGSSGTWYKLVPANHLLLIPAGLPHSYGGAPGQSWSIDWVHFSGEASADYFFHVTQTPYVAPIPTGIQDRVLSLYHELLTTVNSGFEIHNLVHASQVLAHLLGVLFVMPAKSARLATVSGRAIQTMKENVGKQISLEDLAEDADLSRAHFSVCFKKETGYSPIDYFNHLKIRHACRLLESSSYNIGEVGQQVGIDNIHYFSRLFSKVMGMSPSAYRKLPRA